MLIQKLIGSLAGSCNLLKILSSALQSLFLKHAIVHFEFDVGKDVEQEPNDQSCL